MAKLETCKKGLHDMTPDNVWTRPSDGRRYCRECRKVSRAKAYQIKAAINGVMKDFPAIIKDEIASES